MDQINRKLFEENMQWFNMFFKDLKTLYDNISTALINQVDLEEGRHFYYYAKPNLPSIPDYYVMGMRKKPEFAIQVYVILEPKMIKNPDFKYKEPSFIIVKHSRPDRMAHYSGFGNRVIYGNVKISNKYPSIVSGEILGRDPAQFHAFQVLLDPFINNPNPEPVIDSEIVKKLLDLENWN